MTQTQQLPQTVTPVATRGRHTAQGKRHLVVEALSMSYFRTACGQTLHGWSGDAATFPVTCGRCPQ